MKSRLFFLPIIITVIAISCKQKTPEKDTFTPSFSTLRSDSSGTSYPNAKKETYYGLLTPVEICVIFNRLAVPYSSAILNPTSNRDLYLSNSKASINTGIYGVDFGYLKMFGIGQEAIDYMVTIRDISNKLGIPDNLLMEPLKRVQNDISDIDTITSLMESAYTGIEDHLRLSGRESTAGLMVMGGWVEAMYIATQLVYNPVNPDPEVVQKISEQKYTLTSLLSFMKNYYDDPVVVYYTKKLKYLKNYFDTFEIYFKKGDLEIDTLKQVLRSSGAKMTVSVETLNKIRDYVAKLRTEMATP
ncbi:MAG: hypothetical protein MUC93_08045 [Bacteroidales bacterium]|jgi:hypothetical protein|nr:hypothetical protein [Bacteroidales bacterium]